MSIKEIADEIREMPLDRYILIRKTLTDWVIKREQIEANRCLMVEVKERTWLMP